MAQHEFNEEDIASVVEQAMLGLEQDLFMGMNADTSQVNQSIEGIETDHLIEGNQIIEGVDDNNDDNNNNNNNTDNNNMDNNNNNSNIDNNDNSTDQIATNDANNNNDNEDDFEKEIQRQLEQQFNELNSDQQEEQQQHQQSYHGNNTDNVDTKNLSDDEFAKQVEKQLQEQVDNQVNEANNEEIDLGEFERDLQAQILDVFNKEQEVNNDKSYDEQLQNQILSAFNEVNENNELSNEILQALEPKDEFKDALAELVQNVVDADQPDLQYQQLQLQQQLQHLQQLQQQLQQQNNEEEEIDMNQIMQNALAMAVEDPNTLLQNLNLNEINNDNIGQILQQTNLELSKNKKKPVNKIKDKKITKPKKTITKKKKEKSIVSQIPIFQQNNSNYPQISIHNLPQSLQQQAQSLGVISGNHINIGQPSLPKSSNPIIVPPVLQQQVAQLQQQQQQKLLLQLQKPERIELPLLVKPKIDDKKDDKKKTSLSIAETLALSRSNMSSGKFSSKLNDLNKKKSSPPPAPIEEPPLKNPIIEIPSIPSNLTNIISDAISNALTNQQPKPASNSNIKTIKKKIIKDETPDQQRDRIRLENRERKKRWRDANKLKNQNNDLRARLKKRATHLFGSEESDKKTEWIELEFEKRKNRRIFKSTNFEDLTNLINETINKLDVTNLGQDSLTAIITQLVSNAVNGTSVPLPTPISIQNQLIKEINEITGNDQDISNEDISNITKELVNDVIDRNLESFNDISNIDQSLIEKDKLKLKDELSNFEVKKIKIPLIPFKKPPPPPPPPPPVPVPVEKSIEIIQPIIKKLIKPEVKSIQEEKAKISKNIKMPVFKKTEDDNKTDLPIKKTLTRPKFGGLKFGLKKPSAFQKPEKKKEVVQ